MQIRSTSSRALLWILSIKPCWISIAVVASNYFNIVSCSSRSASTATTGTKEGTIIFDFGNQRSKIPTSVRRFHNIKTLGSQVGTKAATILSRATIRPIRRTMNNIVGKNHRPLKHQRFNATTRVRSNNTAIVAATDDDCYHEQQQIHITADLASFLRLAFIIAKIAASSYSAFVGTLRLLAPMIVARRVILSLLEILTDYMTGRYFRTNYTRVERAYLRYYEAPAALRAMARTLSQILIFFWLSMMMSWLTGVATTTTSASAPLSTVSFLEGFLWISSVVGSGHAFTQYVAKWGGPLRIQTHRHDQEHTQRTILQQVFVQPFHIIQFMQDPAQWINLLSTPSQRQQQQQQRAFVPNPLIFPITWGPLRILQMVALAHIMCTTTTAASQKELMRYFLIQLSLGDEWCRVLLEEKRIGLGIVTVLCYMCSLVFFLTSAFSVNTERSYLLLPSVVACFVSGWMNVVIFWNRMDGQRKDAFQETIRNAFIKAVTLHPPVY